jgi:hypothetical protein
MRHFGFMVMVLAGACGLSSCIKSTSSANYDSVWKPYSSTQWVQPGSGILNFNADNGGFTFDVPITRANTADSLAVSLVFIPSLYIISNIETGGAAQFTISTAISSMKDSMHLKTIQIDPATHDTTRFAYFQFGRVRGSVRTFGVDSVFTQPRVFASGSLFTYAPSIHPDSCSKKIELTLFINWNSYTGPAVLDSLTATTVTVKVSDMALTVTGVAVLK